MMKRFLIRLAVLLLVLVPFTLECQAQWIGHRRGGWSNDPVWRRREVLALASVLSIAVVAYEVNRILNRTRKRGPARFLEDCLSPPGETEHYLKGLEPKVADPLHTDCDG